MNKEYTISTAVIVAGAAIYFAGYLQGGFYIEHMLLMRGGIAVAMVGALMAAHTRYLDSHRPIYKVVAVLAAAVAISAPAHLAYTRQQHPTFEQLQLFHVMTMSDSFALSEAKRRYDRQGYLTFADEETIARLVIERDTGPRGESATFPTEQQLFRETTFIASSHDDAMN